VALAAAWRGARRGWALAGIGGAWITSGLHPGLSASRMHWARRTATGALWRCWPIRMWAAWRHCAARSWLLLVCCTGCCC
jgi:hypothetical protein